MGTALRRRAPVPLCPAPRNKAKKVERLGCLSNPRLWYIFSLMSLKQQFVLAALIGCGSSLLFADTIQLKDASAITGKILG